jgi:hypothetical protein
MTAYREKCLRMADILKHGPASPAALARQTSNSKAGEMLRINYYGWFERAERGIYRLTAKGTAALTEHAEVIAGWPVQEAAVSVDVSVEVSTSDYAVQPKKRSRKKKPEQV